MMNDNSSSTKIKRKMDGKLAMSRKIRWISELDHFNRSSLALERVESGDFIENRKTKKQEKFDFLPKVGSSNQTYEDNVLSINKKNNRKKNRKKKAKNKNSTDDLLDERNSKIGMENCCIVSQSISDSQDEDIEFKPRLKNKNNIDIIPHNIISLNDFDQVQSAYFSKENIDESTRNIQINNTVLKTSNSEMKETNLVEKKIRNSDTKSLKSCNNIIFLECSQNLTDNLTPDTSGNSQGTFNIQYSIEQEYMSETSIMAPSSSNKISEHSVCQTSEEKSKLKDTITSSTYENIFQTPESKLERSSKKSFNTEKNGRESIINLITPSPKQQSLCDKTVYTPTPIKSNPSSEKCQIKQVMIGENNKQMFLCRSSTFTKECKKNDNSPKVQFSENHVSSGNSIRKRWTKSLGVSLLDNSGNLHLITARQTNELLNSPSNVIPSSNNMLHHIKDQHIFSHQPIIASTPITKHQKQNGTAKILSDNKKKSEVKSIKRTKMPNFAQIHQKAFEKLENIKEMSERKAARAQVLLSGLKPEIGVIKKTPSKSRKALHYGPTISNSIPTRIPMFEASRNISKPLQRKIEQSKVNSCIPVTHHMVTGKEKKLPHIKKPIEKKGIHKPGFKTDAAYRQKTLQKSNLKELVNKKRIVTETTENRRNVIQNVRTNRRFELLMQMRKK